MFVIVKTLRYYDQHLKTVCINLFIYNCLNIYLYIDSFKLGVHKNFSECKINTVKNGNLHFENTN